MLPSLTRFIPAVEHPMLSIPHIQHLYHTYGCILYNSDNMLYKHREGNRRILEERGDLFLQAKNFK